MRDATTSRPTGQWFIGPADGHRWWFDSGALALDFAYTGGMADNGVELWRTPADLADWLTGRFEEVDATTTDRDLTDALALRSAIARIATGISRSADPAGEDIDVLNLFAATPDIPPMLAGGRRQAGRARARAAQAFSEIARGAIELFAADQRERIRECAAEDCRIVFADDSRSNNRRWCSMQRCGNRAKVRAHRAKISTGSIGDDQSTTRTSFQNAT
ncbi:MAG: CGNR zinc finger domain-containing protein [Rhodoglobus sp.]